jgi:diacylglycerol kinase (ATP)
MKRSVAVVLKPPSEAARLDELREAVAAVRARGHRVSVRLTFEGGDARRFARRAAIAGWDVVVAAGGDGTLNEVVNGLMSLEQRPLLGVLPLGTGNDFAGGLGLPEEIGPSLLLAAEGRSVPMDVAVVNRRCFINVSTGGFGAAATHDAGSGSKRRLGRLAYLLSGAQRLVRLEPSRARFRADGRVVHDGEFVFFAVGNAQRTGGGTWVTPEAEPDDGELDLVLVPGVSRLDFLQLLPEVRAGRHLDNPDVIYVRARAIDVESELPLPVNADGEAVAGRRLRYRLVRQGLRVVARRARGAATPVATD